ALEEFPLDTLIFSGHLELGGQAWAVITAPDGFLHRLKVGNHIGTNHGLITNITETIIRLTEVVPDGLGGWFEREAAISVKE
ncbi:MAG: pilus assembly protein PilP, partial [Gammaproteobacteria bacterium]|nr:pilus assembly protein PilP [Gammaproteobacteria bacterium]